MKLRVARLRAFLKFQGRRLVLPRGLRAARKMPKGPASPFSRCPYPPRRLRASGDSAKPTLHAAWPNLGNPAPYLYGPHCKNTTLPH
ncbi:hypothetical protein NDU88_002219 [Pleurodeles waltl]|uniref:Uncharacterized protein n=1 Tax=Pleurodeles waltl TaxID=8319 RepID=A0AAV7UVI5_PLEWA|nr:hypothetical protein NDU88_002219 [Pleurodeles waltl]